MRPISRITAAIVLVAVLAGCGSSGGSATGGTRCELSDGATVTAEQVDSGCTIDGDLVVLLGYTDCDDGSDLFVVGEADADAGSGWVTFPQGATTSTWHAGAWGEAWSDCYSN